jgi:hypothetical protein
MTRSSTAKYIFTREAMEIEEQKSIAGRPGGDQISAAVEPSNTPNEDNIKAARIVREVRSRNARKAAFKRWGIDA